MKDNCDPKQIDESLIAKSLKLIAQTEELLNINPSDPKEQEEYDKTLMNEIAAISQGVEKLQQMREDNKQYKQEQQRQKEVQELVVKIAAVSDAAKHLAQQRKEQDMMRTICNNDSLHYLPNDSVSLDLDEENVDNTELLVAQIVALSEEVKFLADEAVDKKTPQEPDLFHLELSAIPRSDSFHELPVKTREVPVYQIILDDLEEENSTTNKTNPTHKASKSSGVALAADNTHGCCVIS